MLQTMAERIAEARRLGFVGRSAELKMFEALLAQPDAAVVVLHGPAGVGKSSLLRQWAAHAERSGAHCHQIDARDIPPTAEALAFRLGAAIAGADSRTVVFIDHYELLATLDDRFRDDLAPQLPGDVIVVLAGHHPPSAAWRSDPGWAPLLRSVRLTNLSHDDAARMLTAKGVPSAMVTAAVDFTHGHPLALALVGEVVREKGVLTPGDSADVIAVLIDRLLAIVPSRSHRAALEAAAQVRVIDESLLAVLLDVPDAGDLFGWMRQLPFVDAGPFGLYLHDLARDVLAADLRWRHVERYVALHQRARDHYLARLGVAEPLSQAAILLDLIYLHPDLRQFLQAPDPSAALQVQPAQAADLSAISTLVERHEGVDSARLARHWWERQPDSWLVVRDGHGEVVGLMCLLALTQIDSREQNTDPAVAAAFRRLSVHAPLRPGETATLVRFWLSRDDYQSVSPVQSLIATQLARHYLTSPGLAISLLPFAHPDEWAAFCVYADQGAAPEADFQVGGRPYTSFDHDWRTVPPAAWVARLSLREVGTVSATTASPTTPTLLVLAESEFAAAVRTALREFTRPDRLRNNPLLRCRVVTSQLGSSAPIGERVVLLQNLVKAAVDTLGAAPADRRLHRVLIRAYLAPAPSLERAAEVLELPSSTFRRLLGIAIGRVVTVLWQSELDG